MIKVFCDKDNEFYSRIAQKTYKYLGVSGNSSLELVLTDDEDMARLNLEFRGIDSTTDVLSFPSLIFSDGIKKFNKENYPLDFDGVTNTVGLGSIVISEARVAAQAEEYGHSLEREKAYLFVHGLLHLFGYDHINEDDSRIMRELEEAILGRVKLGIDT